MSLGGYHSYLGSQIHHRSRHFLHYYTIFGQFPIGCLTVRCSMGPIFEGITYAPRANETSQISPPIRMRTYFKEG